MLIAQLLSLIYLCNISSITIMITSYSGVNGIKHYLNFKILFVTVNVNFGIPLDFAS